MKTEELPDFEERGVCVNVYADGFSNTGFFIVNPHFKKYGNRIFLAGKMPNYKTYGPKLEGAAFAIDWEKVTAYFECNSFEDLDGDDFTPNWRR